jgi:hypothetical protein
MEVLSHKFDKLYPDREEESILAVNTASPALLSMEKLKEHNIFCFPVMNADHEQRIVGLLDLVDVCAFVVKLWDEQPEDSVRFDVQFKNALEGKTASDVMSMYWVGATGREGREGKKERSLWREHRTKKVLNLDELDLSDKRLRNSTGLP